MNRVCIIRADFPSMKHRIGAQLGVKRFRRFTTNLSWTLWGDLLHVLPKNVSIGLKLNTETSMQPWDRKRPRASLQVSL